ncbi:hypothetical protein JCM15519_19830 [Fundidesulfovibrio butyratiphilus]
MRFSSPLTAHYAGLRVAHAPDNGVADAKQAQKDGGASSQETEGGARGNHSP